MNKPLHLKKLRKNLAYKVKLSNTAKKQLAKLDKPIAKRIIQWMRERIETYDNPRLWGEPLVGEFSGLWKYRIGTFRLICEIKDNLLIVLVLEIGHRKEIYS
jgi:mRNA interferase RelE/StbE